MPNDLIVLLHGKKSFLEKYIIQVAEELAPYTICLSDEYSLFSKQLIF